MKFESFSQITGGEFVQMPTTAEISHLIIDSRKAVAGGNNCFVAIKGMNHDGHDFVAELYQQNIRFFILQKGHTLTLEGFPEASILEVPDSILALQDLAAHKRKQFKSPVIGITGSNGKTIVKEWLSEMLAEAYTLLKSPKSYNSQVGVPLSVWPLQSRHQMAVFEAGISQQNEMARLQRIIRPTIGIFTNLGPAHDEGFSSRSQKAAEKALLFTEAETIIYHKKYEEVEQELQKIATGKQMIAWSFDGDAPLRIHKIESTGKTIVSFEYRQPYNFVIPFTDRASQENCMHCIICMIHLGLPAEVIQTRLHKLNRINMRLEIKQGINDCLIIDDSYSNDLTGLQMALDFLRQQKQKRKKSVILSDIYQSGLPDEILYKQVAEMIDVEQLHRFIGIGKNICQFSRLFPANSAFYADTTAFLESNVPLIFDRETVLVKGARIFQFERVVEQMQSKIHGTVLEINLDALTHNLNFYRSLLSEGTKIMVMVKAFAYGSGLVEVGNLLQYHRVDYLGVAYTDEGVALRQNGIRIPVMVMNPDANDFIRMIQYQLEPEIYEMGLLHKLIHTVERIQKPVSIHLKFDTGMHRLGFMEEELPELINILQKTERVTVASVFSHLVGADETLHDDFTHKQAEVFQRITRQLQGSLSAPPLLHLTNSPATVRFPEYHFDMVRLGLGLYGVDTSGVQQRALQSISSLKTRISQIKKVKKGETIGYSRKGLAERNMRLATIAIGYADGYQRAFSNGRGLVLIRGKKVPVTGNVCMDMTMVDITNIPDASVGDEVVVFGSGLPVTELSERIGTIPYEILTNVSERVKRVFFTE